MLVKYRGRAGIGIFFITGAGPGFVFFYCRGRDIFIAEAGPGFKFFYCRGRGWAGIKNFEITGAGTGKIENAEAGPGSDFFYCRGRAGI